VGNEATNANYTLTRVDKGTEEQEEVMKQHSHWSRGIASKRDQMSAHPTVIDNLYSLSPLI